MSISLPQDLLKQIDARAKALGLARSQYLALVAKNDVKNGGPLTITDSEFTDEVFQFLKIAVPALSAYQENNAQSAAPDAPEPIADSEFWQLFLEERDEILKHKWIESKNVGYDIGMERAIREWFNKHRALWAAAKKHPTE